MDDREARAPPQVMLLGELRGQFGALESRMTRSETETRVRLASMDEKLERIATTLANAAGARFMLGLGVRWVATVTAMVVSAVAAYLMSRSKF